MSHFDTSTPVIYIPPVIFLPILYFPSFTLNLIMTEEDERARKKTRYSKYFDKAKEGPKTLKDWYRYNNIGGGNLSLDFDYQGFGPTEQERVFRLEGSAGMDRLRHEMEDRKALRETLTNAQGKRIWYHTGKFIVNTTTSFHLSHQTLSIKNLSIYRAPLRTLCGCRKAARLQ